MGGVSDNLTGVWHGLYSYPRYLKPVYFVASVISSGSAISGTTHEAATGAEGAPLQIFASLSGSRDGHAVTFLKAYDGTAGWDHSVCYDGTLNADLTEVEGTWNIHGNWSGRFLMIRRRGISEQAIRSVFADA